MCGGKFVAWPRVVVERLDDLSKDDLDDVVAHAGVGGSEAILNDSIHGSLAQQLGDFKGAAVFDGDFKGASVFDDGDFKGAADFDGDITGAAPFDEEGSATLAPYQEEMQVGSIHEGVTSRISLPLLDLGLETLMDAPSLDETPLLLDTPTTESMLDRLLESAMVGDMEDGKQWNQDLEDLFPDLV